MKLKILVPVLLLAFCIKPSATISQPPPNRQPSAAGGAVGEIKESEIKRDLFQMAGDPFRGREAGTLDEMKVSMWFAEKLRAAGLKPAGDDSTYFQFFSMARNRVAAGSSISIGDKALLLWKDVLIAQTAPATISVPVVFIGKASEQDIGNMDLAGKAVAIEVSGQGINLDVSLPERRYAGYVLRKYNTVLTKGASAIIFIADAMGEKSWSQVMPAMMRGTYDVAGGPNEKVTARPPVLWVHGNMSEYFKQSGLVLHATINIEHFEYPSVNIVGKIEGTDPVLRNEYVLFSGHQDHDGVRQPYGTDSIYNGADDNASVSVAILAIARSFRKQPGKRSALFVWHGAEERGLLGSKWFSAHPTVPQSSIAAVLNGDMIGRNNPDSAALLGVQPPHRNSSDLAKWALDANSEGPRFKLDTLWDKATHVEGWYFRSDHLPYARAGIPSVFFTTLLHPDYHTPMDDAGRINTKKLTRVAQWMYMTGWKVANNIARPNRDANFRLER